MNADQIKQRFKQVEDQVDAMAKQLEQDIRDKSSTIREETVKKVSGAFGSQ
jgi:hypothetical protein